MEDATSAVVTVWREQAPRLVGALMRMTQDLDLAEDLASEAMVAALEQRPASGIPDSPAAWLMTVAKRKAVDDVRRNERHTRAEAVLVQDLRTRTYEEHKGPDLAAGIDGVEDDVLRLMLMTCHPSLTTESQVRADAPAARRADLTRDGPRLARSRGDRRPQDQPRQDHPLAGDA